MVSCHTERSVNRLFAHILIGGAKDAILSILFDVLFPYAVTLSYYINWRLCLHIDSLEICNFTRSSFLISTLLASWFCAYFMKRFLTFLSVSRLQHPHGHARIQLKLGNIKVKLFLCNNLRRHVTERKVDHACMGSAIGWVKWPASHSSRFIVGGKVFDVYWLGGCV
jgi:hypothetical protein